MNARDEETLEEVRRLGLRLLAIAEEERLAPSDKTHVPTEQTYSPATLASFASQIYRSRRERDRFLPANLFKDPAWDMLLELFIARVQQKRISVTVLASLAEVPPTTALRWIGLLEEARLLKREENQRDARVSYLSLTDQGYWSMYRTLESQLRIFRGGDRPSPVGGDRDTGDYLIQGFGSKRLRAV